MPMAAEEFPCLGDPGVVARFHGRAVPAIEIAGRGFVGRDVSLTAPPLGLKPSKRSTRSLGMKPITL